MGARKNSKIIKGSETLSQTTHNTGVSFSDVAGCDEAVEEVAECVDFLKYPERFEKVGAKMPAGIILHGPPGTGKTLLAKALATEANLPFLSVSGSDFIEMFVGVGAKRVRALFDEARKYPEGSVIFIDEIDSFGGERGKGSGGPDGGNDERVQTLNQFLKEMEGFTPRDKIMVVAATNRLDTLDEALLRPGRLSRHIPIERPDEKGRYEILKVHSKSKPMADDVDLKKLAKITAGSSGADLADMTNEAAMLAARQNHSVISMDDLEEGHLRALLGPKKKNSNISAEDKEAIAFHEAGHILCTELSITHEKTQRASIEARTSGVGGFAMTGSEDRALHSTRYFHESLVICLGGRAAEKVAIGEISSGAANDLIQANSLARVAVQELGFSPLAGQVIHDRNDPFGRSDKTKNIADEEVERMVNEAFQEAVRLLEEHRLPLTNLANTLLEKGNIGREEIVAALALESGPIASRVSGGSMGVKSAEAVVAPATDAIEPEIQLLEAEEDKTVISDREDSDDNSPNYKPGLIEKGAEKLANLRRKNSRRSNKKAGFHGIKKNPKA